MNLFPRLRAARATVANAVWRTPKGRLSAKLRKACDGLPHNQRLTVITVLLVLFVLAAFFVFGNACYKVGLGHARHAVEVEHIGTLALPDKSVPDVKPSIPAAYDDAGIEGED